LAENTLRIFDIIVIAPDGDGSGGVDDGKYFGWQLGRIFAFGI